MNQFSSPISRLLDLLQKDYIIIGKERVPSRIAWIIIGVTAGLTVAIALLASRSGTFEESQAAAATLTATPSCDSSISKATITWPDSSTNPGGSFWVDVDNDNNWSNGFWNKYVPARTFSTIIPDGLNPYGGASGSLTLKGGSSYRVRVYYVKAKNHSSTISFTAASCGGGESTRTNLFTADINNANKVWVVHRPFNSSDPLYGPVGEKSDTARWHILQWNASSELPGKTDNVGDVSDGTWQIQSSKLLGGNPQLRVRGVPQGAKSAFQLFSDTTGLNFIGCSPSNELDLFMGPNPQEFLPPSYPMGFIPTADRPSLGAAGNYRVSFTQRLLSGQHTDDGVCAPPYNVYSTTVGIHFVNTRANKHFQYQIITYDSRGMYPSAVGSWYDSDGSDGYCGANDDIQAAYGKSRLAKGGSALDYDLDIESRLQDKIKNAPSSCWGLDAKNMDDWKPLTYYIGSYLNGKAQGEVEVSSSMLYTLIDGGGGQKQLTFKSGSITPSNVSPNGSYQVNCDYGEIIDCIAPKAPSGSCSYKAFSGTTAQFSCTAGSAQGTFNGSCSIFSGTPSNCASRQDSAGTLTVKAQTSNPVTYQASTDFANGASQKGYRGWYYLDSSGNQLTYYTSHPDCSGVGPCWRGSEPYLLVYPNGQHPGPTKDSIRRWVAPSTGSVHITGSAARPYGSSCTGDDGVAVSIKKGSTSLWSSQINDGDASPKTFDKTVNVNSGDSIDFQVNRLSLNNACDPTTFDPKIEFTAAQ